MEKAKLCMQGQNQVVILPDEFRFDGNEVIIKKQDNMVILVDENDEWERFLRGVNGFTDDFFPNGREQN